MAADTTICGAGDHQRTISLAANGKLQLTLAPKLRVAETSWTPSFVFELESVAMEAMALVEAKLRDQEDEIVRLGSVVSAQQDEIGALRAAVSERPKRKRESSAYVSTFASGFSPNERCIVGAVPKKHGGEELVEFKPADVIRVLKSPWINVVVNGVYSRDRLADTSRSEKILLETKSVLKLAKNNRAVAWYFGRSLLAAMLGTLCCMLDVKESDELKVQLRRDCKIVVRNTTVIIQEVTEEG